MRNRFLVCLMCMAATFSLTAQSKFTDRLQKSEIGQGKVTLNQSKAIENLVNGSVLSVPQASQGKTVGSSTVNKGLAAADSLAEQVALPGRKVRMNGYRIQVYSGSNSRSAKNEALSVGQRVKTLFMDIPVYTHFVSPHWVCRVGDFKTYEEAFEMLRQLKETGRFDEAVLVKSRIIVLY